MSIDNENKKLCCQTKNCKTTKNEKTESLTLKETINKPCSTKTDSSKKLVFKIEGLCCATEVEDLKTTLNPLISDKNAILSFDLINAKLTIELLKSNEISKEEIIKTVSRTGMKAILWSDHVTQSKNQTFWTKYGHGIMNITSAIGLVIGLTIHAIQRGATLAFGGDLDGAEAERPDFPPIPTMIFYGISILAGAWFILPKALISLKRLKFNEKLLTVLATGGAIGLNKWFEAAISMYLFSAAELLEAWNMARARRSIRALMELAPSSAHVVTDDGTISEKSVVEVPVGATISIKPGEKIPLDSVLLSGFASINQAPITGESLPVQKDIGDALFAGTINGDSAITCKVTKISSDSMLASIIQKVEDAQSKRAQSDQWIEKFAQYYVPIMILASVLVAIIPPLAKRGSWYSWIYKGLELLVISCPCSLVVSTPVTIVAGITAAARAGVLIKGGIHLETSSRLRAFAMDKTGTLTTGEPIVHEIVSLSEYHSDKILEIAMSLEIHSDHPLARAIQHKAKENIITYKPAEQFQVYKGKGAEGVVDNQLYWIGSHRFLHEKVGSHEPIAIHDRIKELESKGHSIVALGKDIEIMGLISIADAVRTESKEAIRSMKKAGVQRVVMLTGDNEGAATIIAKAVEIDEYHAELLPEDKVKQVESLVLKYKYVAMVGDGINDAPAMAASSLGIAMGSAGSDTAIETADVALMSDDLKKLSWLVNHSRRTMNIIKQNVVFSLAVKSVFVGLTFANKSSLWLAIVADMGATFIVVSNALRLVGFRSMRTTKSLVSLQPKDSCDDEKVCGSKPGYDQGRTGCTTACSKPDSTCSSKKPISKEEEDVKEIKAECHTILKGNNDKSKFNCCSTLQECKA